MMRWLRQLFCEHECRIANIQKVVDEIGVSYGVICPCHKCGKTLHAPYGLALPARLVR